MTNDTMQKMAKRLRPYLNWAAALLVLCAVQAYAAVTVNQSPLVIQTPLPPNIVLMLDDSGSMAWDYMPDSGYMLGSTTGSDSPNSSDYIAYNTNGIYYNPTITYLPPVDVNGNTYTTPTFPNGWYDGINQSTNRTITSYTSNYRYYTTLSFTKSGSCPTGTTQGNGGTIGTVSNTSSTKCYFNAFQFNAGTYTRSSGGTITRNYTTYYVAPTTCGGVANCYVSTDTSGSVAPAGIQAGINISNWFSFYRTRILAAKTGLTLAFNGLNTTYRFGFGSINGNNTSYISPIPSYSFSTYTKSQNLLAKVEPFGNGASGTQRYNFWNWLMHETANGSTPLKDALNAVGTYYKANQPWQNSDSDTTQYACRQSYTIMTTDGFWNYNNLTISNIDGTSLSTAITGPNSQSYTYTAAAPFSDSYSNTLADVAMKYWNTDLNTNLANEVPVSEEDPAFWQHMVTFTLGLGWSPVGITGTYTLKDQSGQTIKTDSPPTMSDIFAASIGTGTLSNFAWPQPSGTANNGNGSIYNIADLAHAAVNGHGGFYSVKNPQDFINGINDALSRISQRTGSGASLAANSTKLDTGTVTYQANYYTGAWKGDLKAYSVSTSGVIAQSPSWTASTVLPTAANRNIYTYNGSAMASFSSPSTLSAAEQSALGSNSTAQQNMINYLRGDNTNEQKNNGSYRNRDTPLGDIVNSQPVYVGAPSSNLYAGATFTGASSYPAFAAAQASRTPLLYVAGNDGMLHAFNASTGVETFAYIPSAVITNGLAILADPTYGASNGLPHQFYNDGELTVADIYAGGSWMTVLVGTTGRGLAKSVYAFNITNPASPSLIWERSASDGLSNASAIGEMVGKPVIALLPDGQWSVLIGNGYNSANNTAGLLEFALTQPSGLFDTTGTLSVISTGSSINNGLAAPVTWIDNTVNGASTYAYAGDLLGNVWSFDLTNNTATLLFTAKDSSGNRQPITAGMLAGKDPNTNNVWLFFGTGEWLNSSDLTNMSTQTWYGIIAQAGAGQPVSLVTNLANGRSSLVQRSIIVEQGQDRVFTLTPNPTDMTGKSGWYMDLISPVNGNEGERMITPNEFQGSYLVGTTRIPQATDVCNPTGRGFIMYLNPFTGTNPSANVFDVNNDGQINSSDTITVEGVTYVVGGLGFASLPNNPIFVGNAMLVSFDNGTTTSIQTTGGSNSSARVSWRELINE